MYKKASRRSGANILSGWSTGQQGGFKKAEISKNIKLKKRRKSENIPIIEWAKSDDFAFQIICLRCLHQSTVKVLHLINTINLTKFTTARDLKPRLKCAICQSKGMVEIKIVKSE